MIELELNVWVYVLAFFLIVGLERLRFKIAAKEVDKRMKYVLMSLQSGVSPEKVMPIEPEKTNWSKVLERISRAFMIAKLSGIGLHLALLCRIIVL